MTSEINYKGNQAKNTLLFDACRRGMLAEQGRPGEPRWNRGEQVRWNGGDLARGTARDGDGGKETTHEPGRNQGRGREADDASTLFGFARPARFLANGARTERVAGNDARRRG
ncbi:unnamed protein product [Linum trigynum]|uniref:Uncharacterized protein n=1 Tax=Linum trigynum TaxID=586398 RepID=A0AAV2CZT0_9ROSI